MQPLRLASVLVGAALFGAAGALPAVADGFFPTQLEPADQERLEMFDTARADAIAEARAGGSPEEVAELDDILAGEPMQIVPADVTGEWSCRTIKLGGTLPIVIYQEFRCRVFEDGVGLQLEKLTGSQRPYGVFYDTAELRLGFAGAVAWGDDEGRHRYGEDPERDQVGYLVQVAPDRMRLELPLPRVESHFDILELTR